MTDALNRISRWDETTLRKPIGYLSPRDIEILQLLDPERRFHYLPSNWIAHFVGGDWYTITNRLGQLASAPNNYLTRPSAQQCAPNSNFKHQVYTLADKGATYLVESGRRQFLPGRVNETFFHKLISDVVDASIEIGCSAPHRRLDWRDIIALKIVPEATLAAKAPLRIPVGDDVVIPDGRPIAITHANQERFILGKEIDRDTEDLSGNSKNSIAKKLLRYKRIFSDGIYRSHFGFKNSVVLYVATHTRGNQGRRLQKVMHLAKEVIGAPTWLLFKEMEDLQFVNRYPEPNGDMLANDWQRVGHEPLNLGAF